MPTKNPNYYKEYSIRKRAVRRKMVLDYLGGKCRSCKTTEGLEIDHVDPSTKRRNVSEMYLCNIDVLMAEVKKCQLLCRSCHYKKSKEREEWQKTKPVKHGTIYGYIGRKCRCRPCTQAKTAYEMKRRGTVAKSGPTQLPAK